MGKGSCKKAVNTKEHETPRPKTADDSALSSRTRSIVHSLHDDDHSTHLLRYAEAILADPNNVSLTKQHLSVALATDLAQVRTADDANLAHCIYVNYKNKRSFFPYAVSPDCYCVFCDFFGPLIEDYHGLALKEASFEPLFGDLEKYCQVDLNVSERSRVLYSEVVVRRNIGGQTFSPLIKSSGRKDIISKLEKVFRKIFEDNTEVAQIPQEWLQRFDSIKNELDDIGAMKNYPDDRLHLIYESVEKTVNGIVLNFDDHLQIITSCNDGRLGNLYKNMFDICNDENLDKIDFIVHPVYGYLTLSPAYIGTGMTIRIIAKFPFLSRIVDLESSVMKNYKVTIETDGSPCSVTGLITLSNRHTFNKTEEEIINDVIEAYWRLSELEDELEKTSPMAIQKDIMPVESFSRLFSMISKSQSKGYTKKYLTPSVVSQYESVRTNFDNTLSMCIRSSAYYPESLYPRATDGDCYTKYRQFFTPILYEANKIQSPSHPNRPDYGIASDHSVHMLHHKDIHSYRVRFSRNFNGFPYPMAMSDNHRRDVERIMIKVIEEFPVEIEGEYCSLESMNTSVYLEKLLQFNLLPNFNRAEVSSGCYRNWPSNRGFFVAKNDIKYPKLILVIFINITEHVKVICLDPTGKSLHSCYDRAVKVMHLLDLRFDKIFSRKLGFGFLTSFPQSVGCGLRISAKVYLKYLGDKREIFENICKSTQLVYRGTNGAGTPAIGNIFDVSLKINMNVTEKWILLTFCQQLKELLYIERSYDSHIPKPTNTIYSPESITDCNAIKNSGHVSADTSEMLTSYTSDSKNKENIEIVTKKISVKELSKKNKGAKR